MNPGAERNCRDLLRRIGPLPLEKCSGYLQKGITQGLYVKARGIEDLNGLERLHDLGPEGSVVVEDNVRCDDYAVHCRGTSRLEEF